MTPATLLTFPRPIDRHPHSDLLPTSHHGFDYEGRPIYWEVNNKAVWRRGEERRVAAGTPLLLLPFYMLHATCYIMLHAILCYKLM
jgi:hypothetical protein